MVKNGLGGSYSTFETSNGFTFRNITRFSVPFFDVGSCRGNRIPRYRLWLSPSGSSYNGFERPTNRYEYLRRIYSQRKVSMSDVDDIEETLHPRRAILVHPELETGKFLASAFEMEGWLCTGAISTSEVLTNTSLPDTDVIIVCSSIFSVEQAPELFSEEELNVRGFYGAVVCLQDAGMLPRNDSNKFYY